MISARRVEYRQGTPLVLVATKITKKNLAAACRVKKSQCGCCKLKINTYICTTKTGFRSLWHGESVAQQVEHNTFNVGVLGSSPSGFTKYPATDMLPDIFLRGALTFGYLLAETPNRPADDIGGSSVRIGLPGRRSSPGGFAKMAGQSRQKTALAKYLRGLSFPDSLNG